MKLFQDRSENEQSDVLEYMLLKYCSQIAVYSVQLEMIVFVEFDN